MLKRRPQPGGDTNLQSPVQGLDSVAGKLQIFAAFVRT
jgi:hypothetical protein